MKGVNLLCRLLGLRQHRLGLRWHQPALRLAGGWGGPGRMGSSTLPAGHTGTSVAQWYRNRRKPKLSGAPACSSVAPEEQAAWLGHPAAQHLPGKPVQGGSRAGWDGIPSSTAAGTDGCMTVAGAAWGAKRGRLWNWWGFEGSGGPGSFPALALPVFGVSGNARLWGAELHGDRAREEDQR